MSSTVAVDDLTVGMYVHLEGGWLSHPFALSSFRISSPDQIETLRRLGLERVRWVPEMSDPPPAEPTTGGGPDSSAAAAAPAPTPEERAAHARRESLRAQREALLGCERQYGEASCALRKAGDSVAAQPLAAGRATEALARGMLDKMRVCDAIGIRLLTGGGDRAAAHALNVGIVALLVGRSLGLADEDLLDLGVGALMHDIGKLELAERHRHVDEGAGAADLAAYREHVARGVAQGRRMALAPGALAVLAQHHEYADGSGFPMQIRAERMSLPARIVAIVDRYDRLCNPPQRAAALTPHEAVATLFAQGRARFDASVLNAFIRVVGVYPAGSLVQLTDDRHAMVVGVNSSRPLKPRVLVHDPRVPRDEALIVNLEHAGDLGIRRSLAAARLPPAALAYLDPRPRVSYYFEPLQHEPRREEMAA